MHFIIGKYSESDLINILLPSNHFHDKYILKIGNYTRISFNVNFILTTNHTPELISNNLDRLFLKEINNVLRNIWSYPLELILSVLNNPTD